MGTRTLTITNSHFFSMLEKGYHPAYFITKDAVPEGAKVIGIDFRNDNFNTTTFVISSDQWEGDNGYVNPVSRPAPDPSPEIIIAVDHVMHVQNDILDGTLNPKYRIGLELPEELEWAEIYSNAIDRLEQKLDP
jgi:hypothetical protein